jgi:hypothetical protein
LIVPACGRRFTRWRLMRVRALFALRAEAQ